MEVKEAILNRKSVRQFLPKEVEKEKLDRLMDLTRRAPTWKNAQGYKIAIVQGKMKDQISNDFMQAIESGTPENPDYPYQDFYPHYMKKRMLELGSSYYGHLGVDRKDKERRKELLLDNFKFFGAPVGIFFLMERGMNFWPTLDLGILVGTLLIAARDEGLETIAQASLAAFPDIVRKNLNLETNWTVAVGVSLGYGDPNALTNQFVSPRVDKTEIIQFYE
ncbi:MAG TPA: nitroreductase [Leptospiraceae bacterium]|nr:nitroreductase [Leptospiraceae bacterium]HMX35247.1 nitroreductase [Leptospiraceae bacterium]HMY31267.1 nitroreductase [Leptospiraceae bacterium]HMZ67520.1 nitroreductase [Leptospiraceae bacterium]HNA10344.1 nitroreductase [Leptospiraceae bacterium]